MKDKESQRLLFQEFNPITTAEWEAVILEDLKGADYQKKLVWKSVEGIEVKPYYRSEDVVQDSDSGAAVADSKNISFGNAWLIRQDLIFKDPVTTSERAIYLLSKGVESVGIHFKNSPDSKDLGLLLGNLPLDQAEFNFSGVNPGTLLGELIEVCKAKGIDPVSLSGSLGCDPFSELVLSGKTDTFDSLIDELPGWLENIAPFKNLRLVEFSGVNLRNSGCSLVQELGFVMAEVVDFLDQITDSGVDLSALAGKITINLAVGSNYFFELAKFRATRALWNQIIDQWKGGSANHRVYLHATSSMWNKTVFDPYVNLLRTTTEAMSAVIGGADSLCVLPFNASYQETTEFSERLARNQQILLREEAYLDKVIDPAQGSYYLETISSQLAEKSWNLLVSIEEKGGFTEAFLSGVIQDAIVSVAEERDARLATRKDILLGTNQFPNAGESMWDEIKPEIAFIPVPDPANAEAQPLIPYRGAEGFERLRLATEKADKKPVVFLLPVGHPGMRKARATFATNFFGCAGYAIVDNIGFASVEEGMKQAKAAGADLIVLCSSDEEYGILGPVAAALNEAAELVIAGYPAEHLELLAEAGIRHFIHVKTNVLESLQGFNELLGINR